MKFFLIKILLLASSLWCSTVLAKTLYMPEGYVGEGVEEFVAVLNAGERDAVGTMHLFYENGESLSFGVTFPAHQRSGVTLKDKGVAYDRPFSSQLETDQPVTATLIHYDHGAALGSNFTDITSTKWSIAEGYIDEKVRDYLSIFNPNAQKAQIEIILYKENATSQKFTINMGGKQRYSFAMHEYVKNLSWFTGSAYGVMLSADQPVVMALAHYDDNLKDGSLTMGHPNHGQSSGYVAEGWVSEQGFEYVNVLNPHNYDVLINLQIQYNSGLTQWIDNNWLGQNQRIGLHLNNWVSPNEGYMIQYHAVAAENWDWQTRGLPKPGSAVDVVANFVHFDHAGLNGVRFLNQPHTYWEFGEGYRSDHQGHVYEFMLVFNPSKQDANVTVNLIYDDGKDPTTLPLKIPAGKKSGLALHDLDAVRVRPGGIWYGSTVTSDVAVVPYFTHYDLSFGGSFALEGTPR